MSSSSLSALEIEVGSWQNVPGYQGTSDISGHLCTVSFGWNCSSNEAKLLEKLLASSIPVSRCACAVLGISIST